MDNIGIRPLLYLTLLAWTLLIAGLVMHNVDRFEGQHLPSILFILALFMLLISHILLFRHVRKLNQVQLRQDEFVANTRRTFQSALSSIKVAGASLLRHLAANEVDEARDLGSYMHSQTARLQRILDQLTEETRNPLIDRLKKREISLRIFFDHCIRDMQIKYKNRPVQIILNLNPEDLHIVADPFYLKTAVLNVLDNSFRYNIEETDLNIEITANKIHTTTKIRIADNGIGVDHDNLKKLGSKFYRTPEHEKIHGIGLGLFQAVEIVEAHGGSVTFQGDTTAGLAVTMSIPDESEEDL